MMKFISQLHDLLRLSQKNDEIKVKRRV